MTAVERSAERTSLTDQALVPYHFAERSRTHPGCQRLAIGRRNERRPLCAGLAGWRGLRAARWHRPIVQVGRPAGRGHGAASMPAAPICRGYGVLRGLLGPWNYGGRKRIGSSGGPSGSRASRDAVRRGPDELRRAGGGRPTAKGAVFAT
jgi:hypothetical protein